MTRASPTSLWIATMLLAASLGGCQVPLAFIELMFPKERVPAVFKLPGDKTVLVFPDDKLNPIGYSPVKRTLAEKVNDLLKENGLAAQTVPYDKLLDLKAAEPDFGKMSVGRIGRKLGADLVIFVDLEQFSLKDTPSDSLWNGRFSAKVRVVDAQKGKRVWPDESAGYPVQVMEPAKDNPSETYGAELARKLGERLAEEVTGLFHEHWVDRHRPPPPQQDSD